LNHPYLTTWRDWLALAAFVALAAICVASVRDVAMRPVRLVDDLDHDQLLDWLCTRDLAMELSATRLRLARRLAEDFRQGYDWQHDLAGLDATRRERCGANVRNLVGVWLLDRADRYAVLTEPDRTAFIDEQLDDLLYWPVWQRLPAHELAGLDLPNAAAAVQQMDAWTAGLDVSRRQRVQQFTGAVYLRWLQRGFQFLPSGV
jgi:hypothetical protein